MKSLDQKLARIRSGQYQASDFIIADAKDAEMASGLMAPGPKRDAQGSIIENTCATRADYLAAIRAMADSELVDIMLMSAGMGEILVREGYFSSSSVTPAVRYNDTTDIWFPRGGNYAREASVPHRTARLDQVKPFVDLGLYSITFSNRLAEDVHSLQAYSAFRAEAQTLGMRHFLEVFNPAFDVGIPQDQIGHFIADNITRSLAGMVSAEQPLFLKIAYNGRAAMEQLSSYDPTRIIVGILGGAKGTTRDTFELLSRAEAAGAKVALFGRKINYAEDPLALVALMRRVVTHAITPQEAVRAYHGTLQAKGIRPLRSLEEDSQLSDPVLLAEAA